MTMGLNLHNVVRGAINAVHPDITATLYQSVGQAVTGGGGLKSVYAPGIIIAAQMQSEGTFALYHAERTGLEETSRKFYLFSPAGLDSRIAGIVRPLSRGGDIFQLADQTWWLVEAVLEDFTRGAAPNGAGWASVRAVMQVNPPDFSHSRWYKS